MTKKPSTIHELVSSWTRKSGNNLGLHGKLALLTLLGDELYAQYQPLPVKPDYFGRLFSWIDQASTVREKKLLFELASWMLFVGVEEMIALYQSSYKDIITRWVIDQASIDITTDDAAESLKQALRQTYFGSIAGMDMGTYCRVNGIKGQSFRPDFREHACLGNPDMLRRYLNDKDYRRIVAVEDIVGSGTQMKEACNYLLQLDDFPTLLCPMIIAHEGVQVGISLAKRYEHLHFAPLFPLPTEAAVPETPLSGSGEPGFIIKLRRLLSETYQQVKGMQASESLYGPFGFRGTGSLLLTYLNCPDTVPPLIHHKSDTWEPLFPRASREG